MRSLTGASRSPWMGAPAIAPAGRLDRDTRVQLCVVGAGITGLTTGYLAARSGRSVIVIDSGAIADGDTGRTTSHLTCLLDRRFFDLAEINGADATGAAVHSHRRAIDTIESIAREERIACGFERADAFLFRPPGRSGNELEREHDACRQLRIPGVAWAEGAPLGRFRTGRCLRFARQALVDPIEYARGLVAAIARHGGRVCAHAHAQEIASGRPGHVTIEDGPTIAADDIVVATHAPVCSKLAMHAKQTPNRTYVIAFVVPHGSLPPALVYDTLKPYHYVRLQPGRRADLLIVGGEDHPTGHEDAGELCWASLEHWTRERYPDLGPVEWRWSGQVFDAHDGLAFIGRDHGAAHLWLATGFSGNGMTYGTIAGMLFHDLLTGKPNEWAELYEPGREITKQARANGDSAGGPPEGDPPKVSTEPDDIPRGEGGIVRTAGHAYAVYRDRDGSLSRCSAKCTHMGCEVRWNSAEKTWDCTCHGSRFDRHGKVIGGPATEDLREVVARERQRA